MPSNDNFANAGLLNSVYNPNIKDYDDRFDWVSGNNIGATAEPFEQPNYGRTVWYKWIGPDPAISKTSNWRVMTAYNAAPSSSSGGPPPNQTDFDTILTVYGKTDSTLPWALTNLSEIFRSDAAAGWEKGSQVIIPVAFAGQEFYLRIDGKQLDPITHAFVFAEGHFLLSWVPLLDVRLMACLDCPPEIGPGWKCIGVKTPIITAENFPSFGTMPKGSYLLKYCGGAWNYRDGFAVSRVPQGADQSWPGNTLGWFTTLVYGANTKTLPEPANPGKGWGRQAEAEASARCMRLAFELTSSVEVKLHYTDQDYSDNSPGTVLPHYGLYQLTPSFKITSSGVLRNAGVGTTRYHASIDITNLTVGFFSAIVFTLSLNGGVSAPTAPVTLDFNPGQTKTATFDYDMLPTGKTDGALVLKVSNPAYDPMPDLTLSLLPAMATVLLSADRVFRSGPATKVCINLGNKGFGPTYNLSVVVTAVNAAGPVTVLNDSGSPQSTFVLGQIEARSVGNCNFLFDLVTVSGAQVAFAYHDTLIDYPPASVGIPSV
jgi:hypothetical protein